MPPEIPDEEVLGHLADYYRAEALQSEAFNTHLQNVPPPYLYHYTSQSGLLGIIGRAELWATKVQYMNDASEFGLALETAEQEIDNWINKNNTGANQAELIALRSSIQNVSRVNIFAASFCEESDLLSQWRAYADNSSGFSLGFEVAALAERSKLHKFTLGKCIYDKTEQQLIIGQLIAASLARPQSERKQAFSRALIRVGAFFKHERFSEEREWRLVSDSTIVSNPQVSFRKRTSFITPYYKLPIGTKDLSAIQHVIIGPCPHPVLSKNSILMLFMQHGLLPKIVSGTDEDKAIRLSQIPYRNW